MRLLFAGDIVVFNIKEFRLTHELSDVLNNHDVCICNLEAPIRREERRPLAKIGPSVSLTPIALSEIMQKGFHVFALANNHIMDYGESGLVDTVEFITESKALFWGAGTNINNVYAPLVFKKPHASEMHPVVIFNVAEAGFGVMKSPHVRAGYAWIHHPSLRTSISQFRASGAYVIVFCHAGLECVPFPLPEWKDCYHAFADAGAHCVIATHPHMMQGMEIYHSCYIYYSLGNFFFDSPTRVQDKEWNRSLMVSINTESKMVEHIPITYDKFGLHIDTSIEFQRDIDYRSRTLADDEALDRKIELIVEKCWNDYYASYYRMAIPVNRKSILNAVRKRFLHFTIEPSMINENFLLHNLQIESHRYAVERYLYRRYLQANGLWK